MAVCAGVAVVCGSLSRWICWLWLWLWLCMAAVDVMDVWLVAANYYCQRMVLSGCFSHLLLHLRGLITSLLRI